MLARIRGFPAESLCALAVRDEGPAPEPAAPAPQYEFVSPAEYMAMMREGRL